MTLCQGRNILELSTWLICMRTLFNGTSCECNQYAKNEPTHEVRCFVDVTVQHHAEKDQLCNEPAENIYGNEDHRLMVMQSNAIVIT
jgi:hypothetical protein